MEGYIWKNRSEIIKDTHVVDIPLPFFAIKCSSLYILRYLQNGVDRPSKPVHNCQRWFRYRSLSDPQRVRTLNL